MSINKLLIIMKKILFLLVLVIAVDSASANGIDPKSPVGVSVIKAGTTFKVFYQGAQSGTVKVFISNVKGEIVFAETMRRTENFMRPYNFSSLPAGEYTITVIDEDGKRSHKITHSIERNERVASLSRVRDGGKYLLTVPNVGQEALTIRIFDESNGLLYSNTEVIEGNFAKLYNLLYVSGAITFEISDQSGKTNRLTYR
jgi:hypothetical protein